MRPDDAPLGRASAEWRPAADGSDGPDPASRPGEARLASDLAGMQRMLELNARLAGAADLETAMGEIVAAACEFTGTDRGCLQLVADDGRGLRMTAWRGFADDGPFVQRFCRDGSCEPLRAARQRLVVADWTASAPLAPSEAAVLAAEHVRASQSTPVVSRTGETLGVLSTMFERSHVPSDDELRLVDLLAWTAANFLERHRAEVALRESEARFRTLSETIPQLLWTSEPHGQWDFATRQWSDYTAQPEPATQGLGWLEVVHWGDRARTLAAWSDAHETGALDVEHRLRRGDGTYRWFRTRAMPLRGADGAIVRWFGASSDVDDRKRAQETLQASEERYRRLVAQVKDYAIFALDTAGRAVSWNEGVERVLGYRRDEFIGLPSEQLFTAEDVRDGVPERELEQARRDGSADNDRWLRRKDGSSFYATGMTTRTLDASGNVVGFSKVLRDDTQRKLAEQQLRASESALRDASRRKDEFLAMLAHELRNPLAPIRTAAQLLKIPTLTRERIVQTSEILVRQVDHMTKLVGDLLDVSRVTRGLVELTREPVDVRQVVAAAVEQCRPLVEGRRHTLRTDVPEDAVHVMGDEVRLVQILGNLLANAAKYSDADTEIAVRVGVEGEDVVVRVEDRGIGIAPELLPHVFDLFVQADRTAARSQGGLGLGLALVKRLVALHGGTVEAHSAGLDQGAEFVVRLPHLPAACATPVRERRARVADDDAARLKVLIVDDNRDAADMLASMLQVQGHDVDVVYDPEDALQRARAEHPPVVLLDIGLPGMDGYELAQRIRAAPEACAAKLVALTGYGQDEDRARARDAGIDHHLVKPVDPDALSELLRRLGDGA